MGINRTPGIMALESCGYTLSRQITDYERYDTLPIGRTVEFSRRNNDGWTVKVGRISKLAAPMDAALSWAVNMRLMELINNLG